jgi:hypothetical protein
MDTPPKPGAGAGAGAGELELERLLFLKMPMRSPRLAPRSCKVLDIKRREESLTDSAVREQRTLVCGRR